jgi:hypothetical protein
MAGSADVEAWFAKKKHPQEALMRKVRKVILDADPRVEETIKWSCPTFTYQGNLVSIAPQAKAFVSLLFHTGATIPGSHPALEGGGGTARYMRIEDEADLKAKKAGLVKVVKAWCKMRDAETV